MRYYTARTNESPKPKPPEPPDLDTLGPSPAPFAAILAFGVIFYFWRKGVL